MHRVWYGAVKSPECKKKSKIAHNFVLTKATDLTTILLKSPWKMHIETCVTLDICLKQNKIFFSFFWPFFRHFFTLPSAQTIKVIGLFFFSFSWPWKIGLWTCISTLYLFSLGGGAPNAPPQAIHRFKPPTLSLYRVKWFTNERNKKA